MRLFVESLKAFLLLSLITGVFYPALVTVLSQVFFKASANGSMIKKGDRLVGSALIGQEFKDAKYFWPRRSVTNEYPYNCSLSSGSNLSPYSKEFVETVRKSVNRYGDTKKQRKIPIDLVTSSASGLDPHISPEGAYFQAFRVAEARHIRHDRVIKLIEAYIEPRTLGVLGEPRVNVLLLNLALDQIEGG